MNRNLALSVFIHLAVIGGSLLLLRGTSRPRSWSIRVETAGSAGTSTKARAKNDGNAARPEKKQHETPDPKSPAQTVSSPSERAGSDSGPGRGGSPASAGAQEGDPSALFTADIHPPYPPLSRRLGEEGEVRVGFTLNTDGSVSEAKVESSSGFERLDRAALEAVRKARFHGPAGRVIPAGTQKSLVIVFKLSDQ